MVAAILRNNCKVYNFKLNYRTFDFYLIKTFLTYIYVMLTYYNNFIKINYIFAEIFSSQIRPQLRTIFMKINLGYPKVK
jgi:hypothetical protein